LFPWKTEVLIRLISNHVVDDATNEGDRGLGHSVREKPGETLGSLLRVAGKINGSKISPVRTRDELDGGRFVEDGREGVGERLGRRHREARGSKG
jgi:hypothetical protein